ncbi:MAG: hypothetical protein BAJALOKI2v1_690012 [Promethearchaeota archaeon]|nr:MAG: hypothetical protein BAJALOKI2v1_690012 [Candidatus Lokiarchaeota archaeon]
MSSILFERKDVRNNLDKIKIIAKVNKMLYSSEKSCIPIVNI